MLSSSGIVQASIPKSSDQAIRLIGRFQPVENNALAFTWPGSAFEFRFYGTKASIPLAATERLRFIVKVDDKESDLWVEGPFKSYTLASNLPLGEHEIRVTRVTESFTAVSSVQPEPSVDGKLLETPPAPARKILAIGDSITAGYGIEGPDNACGYSKETSNQLLTYVALAAEKFNADLHAIAWSGIGAWRSYGEETPNSPTILERYKRTLADDATAHWNGDDYRPDVITILIGTNDYWTGSVTEEYRDGVTALVEEVRSTYPEQPIYLIVSPMLVADVRQHHKQELEKVRFNNLKVIDLGKIEPQDGYGCHWHPNIITNKRMAKNLVKVLQQDLEW